MRIDLRPLPGDRAALVYELRGGGVYYSVGLDTVARWWLSLRLLADRGMS